METQTLTLGYWIHGERVTARADVEISKSGTVNALKDAIMSKNSDLHGMPKRRFDLYAISIPKGARIKDELKQWVPEQDNALEAEDRMSDLFPQGAETTWFIIVHAPTFVTHQLPIVVPDLALNCWVRGDKMSAVTQIKIPKTESISALQKAIKNEKQKVFHNVDASDLELYDVCIPCNAGLEQRLGAMTPDHELKAWLILSNVFPKPPLHDHLHIIVEAPVPNGLGLLPQVKGRVSRMIKMADDFKGLTLNTLQTHTPSQAAKSTEYSKIQRSNRRVTDCRYAEEKAVDTVGPPIQLFNPAFAYFSSKISDPTYHAPDEFVCETGELVAAFAQIYSNESARRKKLRALLEGAIGCQLLSVQNSDKTTPDFVAMGSTSSGKLPVYLVVGEEKKEFGDGGSDPSTQATFSFLRMFCQTENEMLRLKCCCPAFVIAHAGPWLTVMGGIITSNCVVQRLTDFLWIPVHSALDNGQYHRIAQALYALRESIQRLHLWYQEIDKVPAFNVEDPAPHPRFFPYPDTYVDEDNGSARKFVYQEPLEDCSSCVTYLAKTVESSPKDVVVKFVTSYGADVHRAMASAGFAPQLLYHGRVDTNSGMPLHGDLCMVVMEYVKGLTLEDALARREVPPAFGSDLCRALELLHDAGYVFGDLRKPNILVTPDAAPTVQLIDFDWAGKDGEVKYPAAISRGIPWPTGVQGLGLIRKEHDVAMLQGLLSACS